MRSSYERQRAEQIEFEGRLLSSRDKIVPPPLFADFARLCWPEKTAAQLASIAGRDERKAKRWLSGEHEPPFVVVLAIMSKIFQRRG